MRDRPNVPIQVVSRHGHVSTRMEEYAVKKVERLLRFNDRITQVEVVVDGPHEAPEVEILVHVEREANVIAKEKSDHFNSAVDRTVDKLERQLVKSKEKRKQHKGDPGVKDMTPEPPRADVEETYDDVVRKDLDS